MVNNQFFFPESSLASNTQLLADCRSALPFVACDGYSPDVFSKTKQKERTWSHAVVRSTCSFCCTWASWGLCTRRQNLREPDGVTREWCEGGRNTCVFLREVVMKVFSQGWEGGRVYLLFTYVREMSVCARKGVVNAPDDVQWMLVELEFFFFFSVPHLLMTWVSWIPRRLAVLDRGVDAGGEKWNCETNYRASHPHSFRYVWHVSRTPQGRLPAQSSLVASSHVCRR